MFGRSGILVQMTFRSFCLATVIVFAGTFYTLTSATPVTFTIDPTQSSITLS